MTRGEELAAAFYGRGPLGRSADDEPVFVLCARDRVAADVVREWANRAEGIGASPRKVEEALQLADRMDAWREVHGGKVPD